MKIEVLRMFKFDNGASVKAFLDLQFDEAFIVKGFRIMNGKEGLYIAMPSEVRHDNKSFKIFVPLTEEIKTQLTKVALEAYNE